MRLLVGLACPSRAQRWHRVLLCAALAGSVAQACACAGVLGIDSGIPDPDAAAPAPDVAQDAAANDGASERSTDVSAADSADSTDEVEDVAPGMDTLLGPDAEASSEEGCSSGDKACAGGCVAINDPSFGCTTTGCSPCPAISNGAAVCAGGVCAHTCDQGFVDCGGQACSCGGGNHCLSDGTCGPCRAALAPCNVGTDCCSGSCGANLTCL